MNPRRPQQRHGRGEFKKYLVDLTMNKVSFTVFQSPEPLSKRFALAEDGAISKTPAAQMTTGRARRQSVDFHKFDECLDRAGPNVAFCYGLHDNAKYGEVVKIAMATKADPEKKILARTREFFDYRVEPGILMIDHDPHPDGPTLTPGELQTILADIHPPFAEAACWVRGSLSAGVHKKAESAKPGRGFHLYFAVTNASDIPRFGKVLFNRLWLSRHGFIALSGAGSCLVRSVIDSAVFDGERLDFVGKPVVGEGLAFKTPKPAYLDGIYLDTQSLPDLTESEQAQLKAFVEQAMQAREPDRQAKRAEWAKGKVKGMVERGVPEPQARAQVARIAKDGGSFDLYADFPLEFAQLGFPTVKDVLANPARFEGQALADPLEGPEYGRTTAKFYANTREYKPVINSNAHGGQKFFLHEEAEPPVIRHIQPPPEPPPFDPEYFAQFPPPHEPYEFDLAPDVATAAAPPRDKQGSRNAKPPNSSKGQAKPARPAHTANKSRAAKNGQQSPANQADAEINTETLSRKESCAVPTLPTQSTLPISDQSFTESFNLHFTYTELHESYTTRLAAYDVVKDGLLVFDEKGKRAELVAESIAANKVALLLRGKFRFNSQAGVWHRFDMTHWQTITEAEVTPDISAILVVGTGEVGFKKNYLSGVTGIVKKADMLPLPQTQPGKLPFTNGLYDMATGQLEPLTQENADNWVIPHPFDKQADCPRFKAWLLDAMNGNAELVEFLRAFIKACLTGRADLQKLMMLLGPGGTGKGTFLRVLTEMLGQGNCTVTDLRNLETNRFEAAKLYGKRLATITDAGRYTGSIDKLKAITGQDQIPYEEKHQQQRGTFVYGGMVVIASNEQLATNDYTSDLERRLLVVKFNRRYSVEEKATFRQSQGEAALLAETPAIIQWALEMTSQQVEDLFGHPPKAAVDAALESLTDQNPVVEWIRDNLIPDPNARTPLGANDESRDHGKVSFADAETKLYPNYLKFCQQSRRMPLNRNRFRTTVDDMLATLKIPAHSKRAGSGYVFEGIRIRPDVDSINTPTNPQNPPHRDEI